MTKKNTFYGKFVSYKNINWKKNKIEKEFNSTKEYNKFLKENKNLDFEQLFNEIDKLFEAFSKLNIPKFENLSKEFKNKRKKKLKK